MHHSQLDPEGRTITCAFRATPGVKRELWDTAERLGMNRSEVIREALELYFRSLEKTST